VAHFGSHVFFLQNLIPQTHGSIVGPNWTVALEMQFYILMALLITELFKRKSFSLLLIFVIFSWLWRYSTTLFLVPGIANPNDQSIFAEMLPGTLDEFSVGIAVALLWLKRSETNRIGKIFRRRGYNCLFYFVSFVILFVFNLNLLHQINYWSNTYMIVFYRTSLAVSFGFLLMSFVTVPKININYLLPLHYMGKISYGIYLWHIIVLATILERMPWLVEYKLVLVVSAITLALAAASFHLIEKPMIEKGRTLARSKNNASP